VSKRAAEAVVAGFHGIGRARGAGARAIFRDVAGVHCRTAHRALVLEGVGGTGGIRPIADLGHVAGPRRRPALGAGVARRVLAGIARAVAGVGRARIAVVGARGRARLLRIGGTRGIRPVAGLGHVAFTRRRPALRAGVARRVLAGIARAVAGVGRARIAVVGARRRARLLRIGGTRGIRPVAGLGHVAFTRRRPALRAGVARRVRDGIARAVAGVGRARIAVVGARRRARLLRSEGRRGGSPGAAPGTVALPRPRPALRDGVAA